MSRKCTQMNFNATFNSINGITQKFIDNSQNELLKDFNVPQIIPIPEFMQDEIPRIVAVSNGGHSQITLSKINCSITTNFDDNFSSDINKCIEYFDNKTETAIKVINTLENEESLKLKFFGITTELIFDKQNAVQLLQDNMIKINTKDICDINLQISRVIQERYYINVRFSNTRLFTNKINALDCGFLDNEHHNGIQVIIDVNNRYAFSKGKTRNEKCKLEEIEQIKSILENTIKTLPDVYGRGVFNE